MNNKKALTIDDTILMARNSSFLKNGYNINIDLETFVKSISSYTNQEEEIKDINAWLANMTPDFQRKNNKWNKVMQLKFIENLLSGVKVELQLFRIDEDEDSRILDGLQRTTAIVGFIKGKIKPFGYSYEELMIDNKLRRFKAYLTIKIYTFDNWKEVGKFYIDMNENITHSKKDIQKAKDWFFEIHNIKY